MKKVSLVTRYFGFVLLVMVLAAQAWAQGGPPFRTDDPETPGNKHWEINFGWIGDRNPVAGAYQVPDLDINYGLGDRIQLKYELPLAIEETRQQSATGTHAAEEGLVVAGLGSSLLGIKTRFYEHHAGDPWIARNHFSIAKAAPGSTSGRAAVNLSVSTYPQLSLNNPTSSVRRGVVASGPDLLVPLEANARLGPLRVDGEFGYHFGNDRLPQSWIRGLLVGHEFGDRTEAYLELFDQQDANRIATGHGVGQFATGEPKQRETTLGVGGRQALNKRKSMVLLLMGGRSFQAVTSTNNQPSWIAYVGLQLLVGPKEAVEPQVEQKRP